MLLLLPFPAIAGLIRSISPPSLQNIYLNLSIGADLQVLTKYQLDILHQWRLPQALKRICSHSEQEEKD
jgi:uracil DNA glycosylase